MGLGPRTIRPPADKEADAPTAKGNGARFSLRPEPPWGAPYGDAIRRARGEEIFRDGRETIVRVAEDGRPPSVERLRGDLVRGLMGILRPVRDHEVERAGDASSASGTPTSSGPTSTRPTTSSSRASSSPA